MPKWGGVACIPRASPPSEVRGKSCIAVRCFSGLMSPHIGYTRRREAPQDSPQCQPPSNSDNVPHCAPEHGPTYFRLRSTPQNIVILPPIYACLLLISLNHNTSSMSQVGHQDIEGGHAGILSALRSLPHQTHQRVLRCIVIEGHRRQPEVAQAQLPQPCQGEPHFCDSSWPLYSMYSKIAQEEDDKIAERCQRNADGMLIFVSPHEYFRVAAHTNLRNIGRSILSDRRHINYPHVPGSETKSAGCLCVLSREYLSASRHSEF